MQHRVQREYGCHRLQERMIAMMGKSVRHMMRWDRIEPALRCFGALKQQQLRNLQRSQERAVGDAHHIHDEDRPVHAHLELATGFVNLSRCDTEVQCQQLAGTGSSLVYAVVLLLRHAAHHRLVDWHGGDHGLELK